MLAPTSMQLSFVLHSILNLDMLFWTVQDYVDRMFHPALLLVSLFMDIYF